MVATGTVRRRGRGPLALLIGTLALIVGLSATPVTAATLTGQVVNDLNGNGVIDGGDAPLAGVRILLVTGATRGATIAQAITDASGRYGFIFVPAGTFRLIEIDPPGAVSIAAFPGFGGVALDANTIRLTVTGATFSSGNNFLDRVSVVSPTSVTIAGSVFRDDNNSGFIDAGDTPLANVTVQLFTQTGFFVRQTTTNGSGFYSFLVPPGHYLVVEIDPPGVVSINSFPGTGGIRIDPNRILVNAIVNGGFYGGQNFLDRRSQVSPTVGIISGSVFQDTNGNGIVDVPPDQPVPGVLIR
jgi:hypothetical protein